MKKYLVLFLIGLLFTSCQEDLKSNNPGFQGRKDDVFWRANDTRAYISSGGVLSIEAYTENEKIVLSTNSANAGTYKLGTTDTNNSASYTLNQDGLITKYTTALVPGPVSNLSLVSGGTGYINGNFISTTGGSGSGLKLSIVTDNLGVVKTAALVSPGLGYIGGDIVTVSGGNENCKVKILNVQDSNGQVVITEYDNVNMTVTGNFKFNTVKVSGNPAEEPVLNFQYGEFYKIPIYPNL